jgi:AcrR family transcriptional regulator
MRTETRERLLTAGSEVLLERGVAGATLEEVAERAGFSKGAVYSNFAGKAELVEALFERHIEGWESGVRAAVAGDDQSVRPGQLGSFVGGFVLEHERYFRLLSEFWAYSLRDEAIRQRLVDVRRRARAVLTEIVRSEARTAGVELAVPAETLATGILALSIGTILESLVDEEVDARAVHEAMLAVVYRGAPADHGGAPEPPT